MAKVFEVLWKNVASADDEIGAIRALSKILAGKEGRAYIANLDRDNAEYAIDILGRGIAGPHLATSTERQAFFVTLRRLAGTYGRLPDSMTITEKIEVEDRIVANGGFSDVRMGKYSGHLVAVKTLRTAMTDDIPKIRKQFCKEVVLWSTLSHPHVLKLIGVHGEVANGQFVTVSEWMGHGDIMRYIKKNPANRLKLLHEAALGLQYIHSVGLTHGDLKGANILMSNDSPPRACLSDFGFMTMVMDPAQPMSCSAQLEGGTIPFMSPELLVPSVFGVTNPVPTNEADIYAFGMVILQVLTGEVPFRNARPTELGFSVVQGLRPNKPPNASAIGFSESLWSFVHRCWHRDAYSRPRVAEVVTNLASEAANWRGFMPPCPQVENAVRISEPMSDTMEHPIYGQSSTTDPGSPTDSQITYSSVGSPSTICTEPPPEEPPVPIAKRPVEPQPIPLGAMGRRSQEPQDDLREFQHVAKTPPSAQSSLPSPKPKPFRRFKAKLHRFFDRFL